MIDKRKVDGLKCYWELGEEVWEWWCGDRSALDDDNGMFI